MSTELALSPTVQSNVDAWLSGSYDAQTKAEIQALIDAGDTEALTDSFYQSLEFGTGGLRGIMGVGTNRMNRYTVGIATQGLANYLVKFKPSGASAVIAHDSRNNSPEFARIVAEILAANGVKVYLFEALRPTPELSFAIRKLGADTGVVLTASHNPKEYNGYKAYWDDGAQMIAPHDKGVMDEVQKISSPDQVKWKGNESLIVPIGKVIDEAYIKMLAGLSVRPDVIARQKDLKIVYSPIHGTGVTVTPPALAAFGFENVHVLESQATPDGNFPTVVYPNPEEAEAMKLGLEKAKAWDADLLMATDPDTDRVGIAVKNLSGEWQLLNGNQTAALLFGYLLDAWKATGKLTGNEFVVKTIVTTELIKDMSANYGVEMYDVLTGFKFIAGLIADFEGKKTFICGGEESYGYLVGDQVRDKDAVASCCLIAEMAAWAKDSGRTLFELLVDHYIQYGFYLERLKSLTRKGAKGQEEIAQMMVDLRENPPKSLAGSPVVWMKDYQNSVAKNLKTGASEKIDLPKSNVIQLLTEDGTKVSARPSGTEPKIKFYFAVKGVLEDRAAFLETEKALDAKVQRIVMELGI